MQLTMFEDGACAKQEDMLECSASTDGDDSASPGRAKMDANEVAAVRSVTVTVATIGFYQGRR
uniref:Uncharacterized protein n=1 Tax=Cucumis melo TaxID=3656 RepID=A0A9I9CK22_CUCME